MVTFWERAAYSANRKFYFVMSSCSFGGFLFWFRGQDLGSDCVSSSSSLTFYFLLLQEDYVATPS